MDPLIGDKLNGNKCSEMQQCRGTMQGLPGAVSPVPTHPTPSPPQAPPNLPRGGKAAPGVNTNRSAGEMQERKMIWNDFAEKRQKLSSSFCCKRALVPSRHSLFPLEAFPWWHSQVSVLSLPAGIRKTQPSPSLRGGF